MNSYLDELKMKAYTQIYDNFVFSQFKFLNK